MIVGLGTDLVEVARIANAMKRVGFQQRILTPLEQEFCLRANQVAGRWAAKEAIVKAVGLRLTWQQIEILPDDSGAPRPYIHSHHFDPGRLRLHVSISHERGYAIAVAVLERVVFQVTTF